MRIHHVALAIPPRTEDEARQFWVDIVGFVEIRKPRELEARGGVWLRQTGAELHLGVEDPFRPPGVRNRPIRGTHRPSRSRRLPGVSGHVPALAQRRDPEDPPTLLHRRPVRKPHRVHRRVVDGNPRLPYRHAQVLPRRWGTIRGGLRSRDWPGPVRRASETC